MNVADASAWTPEHEQVELPELGFTVDAGLEDLTRACWHRGIATGVSYIGSDDFMDGQAWIGFYDFFAAERWDKLTDCPVTWNDDDEVATVAEAYFEPSRIPELVAQLHAT